MGSKSILPSTRRAMWDQRLSLLEFCRISICSNSLKRYFLFLGWILQNLPSTEPTVSQVRILLSPVRCCLSASSPELSPPGGREGERTVTLSPVCADQVADQLPMQHLAHWSTRRAPSTGCMASLGQECTHIVCSPGWLSSWQGLKDTSWQIRVLAPQTPNSQKL